MFNQHTFSRNRRFGLSLTSSVQQTTQTPEVTKPRTLMAYNQTNAWPVPTQSITTKVIQPIQQQTITVALTWTCCLATALCRDRTSMAETRPLTTWPGQWRHTDRRQIPYSFCSACMRFINFVYPDLFICIIYMFYFCQECFHVTLTIFCLLSVL